MAPAYMRSIRSTTALTVNSRARFRPAAPNARLRSGSLSTEAMPSRQRRRVPGRDQDPGDPVDDHVDDAPGGGGHHWSTRSHRLEHDGRTGIGPHRRDNDRARGPEQSQYLIMRQPPNPLNTIRKLATRRPATSDRQARAAADPQAGGRPPTTSGPLYPGRGRRRTAAGLLEPSVESRRGRCHRG